MVLGIFKITARFRDRHVFLRQSMQVLNFLKSENFFQKNWSNAFYLKLLRLKTQHFHTKLSCQKLVLTQLEWGVQNRTITKNGVFFVEELL